MLTFFTVIVTPVVSAFAYRDVVNSFNIDIPIGWVVTDSYNRPEGSGVMAKSSEENAFISVQHQKIKNAENLIKKTPKDFAINVTLIPHQSSCPDAKITRLITTQEQGYKGVESLLECRNYFFHDVWLAKKNDVYHISGMHDNRSEIIQDTILNSMTSFKIIRKNK